MAQQLTEEQREKHRASSRSDYHKHKARVKTYQRKYYAKNKAVVLAKNEARRKQRRAQYADQRSRTAKSYYAANKAKILARQKQRRMENAEALNSKERERAKRFRREHPEKARLAANLGAHRRYSRKLGTQINEAGIKAWMKQIRKLPFTRCHWCGTKVKGRTVHFDHVVALSKGGTHTIGNLCASCPDCNQHKSSRAIADWIVQGQTFLSL